MLGSQEPEQKRLSEGPRLAWISQTAKEETRQVSKQASSMADSQGGLAGIDRGKGETH